MKVAVLGPVTKDLTTVDGKLSEQIGGIPYYVALTLKNLGVKDIVAYVTVGKNDESWLIKKFDGVKVVPILSEKTLEAHLEYLTNDVDSRKHFIQYYPNTIKPSTNLINELNTFDYIILGPLFHDDIPVEMFSSLKHKNLVLGNFGMFTYYEDGKLIKKNPENLIRVLPFLKYLFLDKNEALFVSGQTTIAKAAEFLSKNGLSNFIVTEGSKGSHLFIGQKYYKIPAFKPKQIADPTGAGDTYLAAFIRAIELFNDDPEKQGKFAAMVATISLERNRAFDSNLKDVLARLGKV